MLPGGRSPERGELDKLIYGQAGGEALLLLGMQGISLGDRVKVIDRLAQNALQVGDPCKAAALQIFQIQLIGINNQAVGVLVQNADMSQIPSVGENGQRGQQTLGAT